MPQPAPGPIMVDADHSCLASPIGRQTRGCSPISARRCPLPEFDTVIKGGLLIDGQAVPRRQADVALKDGKVAYIGKVRSTDGMEVLDAAGMIVAPGFVDLHT